MIWQPMVPDDLPIVVSISDAVHGAFTEDAAVMAERRALYPAGCRVWRADGPILGYMMAHPWHGEKPPALDTLLGALPTSPDTLCLHDVALLPAARGSGAGRLAVAWAVELAHAIRVPHVTLMAVNGAEGYWARQGFEPLPSPHERAYGAGSRLMRRLV